MYVGLGVSLAYRLVVTGGEVPTPDDLGRLVAAARETLDVEVSGKFSCSDKVLFVATSKRIDFARTVLDHFGLAGADAVLVGDREQDGPTPCGWWASPGATAAARN
jgi:hypothetical protein